MSRPLAIVALGTAALLCVIHVLAMAGYAPTGMVPLFPAVLVALLCFGRWVTAVRDDFRRTGNPLAPLAAWPAWAQLLFAAVFIYAGVNFLLFMNWTGGGSLEELNGRAVLADHGRFIRALDIAGVHAFHVWQVRLFSGHALPFLLLPGFHALFASRDLRHPAA